MLRKGITKYANLADVESELCFLDRGTLDVTLSNCQMLCLQATMLIRIAVADTERKKVAQDLEAVLAIVPMLKYGIKHPTTLVAVEALACLVTQDPKGRVWCSCNSLRLDTHK